MTRQDQFNELVRLLSLRDMARRNPTEHTDLRVDNIINQLMDDLYGESEPECTNDAFTCERADCCQEISPELYAALMEDSEELPEELLDNKVNYMGFMQVMDTIDGSFGIKVARKGWDNGLNNEYIVNMPLVGVIKVYQTSKVHPGDTPYDKPRSYFKNVTHTYEPTKDDMQANDWYTL